MLRSVIACKYYIDWTLAHWQVIILFNKLSGVTVINIVVDHPLYYNQFLKALPEHYRQVNIDHMHIDYMKRFFPDVDVYFNI